MDLHTKMLESLLPTPLRAEAVDSLPQLSFLILYQVQHGSEIRNAKNVTEIHRLECHNL